MSQDLKLEQMQLFTQLTTFVGIVPTSNQQQIYLLSGQIKDFKAHHQTTVPLWLALLFKKQQKCKILPPHWMTQQKLLQLYNQQSNKSDLINLNEQQFFEISYIILNNAVDDLTNPKKIRNLIDSLRDLREKIILQKLRNNGGFLINYVTTYEINKFRVAKNGVMGGLGELSKIKDNGE